MEEELSKELSDIIESLKKEVAERQAAAQKQPAKAGRPRKDVTPEWVKDWNRQHASSGQVKHILRTEKGVVEKLLPVVVPPVKESAPIDWAERPTSDVVPPRGLKGKELAAWDAEHPGKPLELRDEGPTKPSRKQMLAMGKVWKYRNFKKCLHCEAYDTWEARTDPHAEGVRLVHAEIWCHTCGRVDLEVSKSLPAHIGTWAPPKETDAERKDRAERRAYRRERALFSLAEKPKTTAQLCAWFREVENYKAVDIIMLDIMLAKMREEQLVVLKNGLWSKKEQRKRHK